jgi:hypothetical protein
MSTGHPWLRLVGMLVDVHETVDSFWAARSPDAARRSDAEVIPAGEGIPEASANQTLGTEATNYELLSEGWQVTKARIAQLIEVLANDPSTDADAWVTAALFGPELDAKLLLFHRTLGEQHFARTCGVAAACLDTLTLAADIGQHVLPLVAYLRLLQIAFPGDERPGTR